jgi:ADP-heptose:LPS heptosyltransferase
LKPPKKLSETDKPKKVRKSKAVKSNIDIVGDLTAIYRTTLLTSTQALSAHAPILSADINVVPPRKIIFKSMLSPGDIVTLTAAVRDLHLSHPGKFITDIRTSADKLWENNPYITKLNETDPSVEVMEVHYPIIHRSNQTPYHFIHGYRLFLEEKLGIKITPTAFKGDIHISNQEKTWMSQVQEITKTPTKFWLIVSGGKYDFTAKWWNPARYQEVVDALQGKVQFVQVGEAGHNHPKLHGVIDLVGKTDIRQMARLMYHADGVVCGVTFLMHLAAAVETKPGMPKQRPAVIIAGGRESSHWEAYPSHTFLHTIGALKCCNEGGCWKSRVAPLGDNDHKDKSLCVAPTPSENNIVIPKCMDMIKASDVIAAINRYLEYK